MRGNGIRLGKFFSIEVFIDYSWIVIFVIITWLLSFRYYPSQYENFSSLTNLFLGFFTSILFFASVLAHELMHSIVAQKNGIKINKIVLFLFGGISEMFEEPKNAYSEFRIAIAGPGASIVLTLIFSLLWIFFDRVVEFPTLSALSSTLFEMNLILTIFNLLPGFPLDGGRMLRSLLWAGTKDIKKATYISTIFGKVVSLIIIFYGILQIIVAGYWGGIWLILIGIFLYHASGQSYLELKIQSILKSLPLFKIMKKNIVFISPYLTINDALSEYFLRYTSQGFPVVDGDEVIGFISLNDIREKVDVLSDNSRVAEAMRLYPKNIYLRPSDKVLKALKLMIVNELTFLPVKNSENKLVGVITLDEIAKYLSEKNVI